MGSKDRNVKWIVISGDGMADFPCEELGHKTPLEVANHPNLDEMARRSIIGLIKTIPLGFDPGSDVAHMALLGFDPRRYYTGRGPLEAVSLGVNLTESEIAARCNLVTIRDGLLRDHSGGGVTDREAEELLSVLPPLKDVEIKRSSGHRSVIILKGGYTTLVKCFAPQDYIGWPVRMILPRPLSDMADKTVRLLRKIIMDSLEALGTHPVNLKRVEEGRGEANALWPWGLGRRPRLPSFSEFNGLQGAIISDMDVIRGIGLCAGMKAVKVPDADHGAKVRRVTEAIEEGHNFVLVHVEAPDEAGHAGDAELKIKAIEELDEKLIGRLLDRFEGEDVLLSLVIDHYTPVKLRKHVAGLMPFLVMRKEPRRERDFKTFSEKTAFEFRELTLQAEHFIRLLIEVGDRSS